MFGSIAVYICDTGYSPYPTATSINTVLLCEPNGQWSNNGLVCEVATVNEVCEDDNSCLEENSRCVDSRYADIGKRCHCKPLFEYVEVNRTS